MNPHDSKAIDEEEVLDVIVQCILDVRDNANIDVLRILVSAYNLAFMRTRGHIIIGDVGDYELAISRDDFGRRLDPPPADIRFPEWLAAAEVTLIRRIAWADRAESQPKGEPS